MIHRWDRIPARDIFVRFLAILLISGAACCPSSAQAGEMLRPVMERKIEAGLEAALGPAAGRAEAGGEEEEPELTATEQKVALGHYQLPPEGLVIELDPARSLPCALGHPPLLSRVRVVDTATGKTAYIGVGCCQTLFGVTPARISAAQTEANHRRGLVEKYGQILGKTPAVLATQQAIQQERLPPAQWEQIDALLAALDGHYGMPISELDRIAREMPVRLLSRLAEAGLISAHEAAILSQVMTTLAPAIVVDPLSPAEIQTLREVHARLARHRYFLQICTLKSWARGQAAAPMSKQDLDREGPRTPVFPANLWVAGELLPGIQGGTVQNVLEAGSGQEPLYGQLERMAGPQGAATVIGAEMDASTFASQRNPRRVQVSVTDLSAPLAPPPTPEGVAVVSLLTQDETLDAAVYVYVLDQLQTAMQLKQAMAEATRVVKPGGRLIVVLPIGRELSQPMLDGIEQMGWTRRPGFPAEIPSPEQRGLPEEVRQAHEQQLAAEGLPADEIQRVLEIEDRFFSKTSYVCVWEKTAPHDAKRVSKVRANRFTLVDVTSERRLEGPALRGLVLSAHWLDAILLASSVTPNQLAIRAASYRTKEELRAQFPDLEPHLESLSQFLPLLSPRSVAGRPRAREEVSRLLGLWHDPAIATFSEEDCRWLEQAHREQVSRRLYDRRAAWPAARVRQEYPRLEAQLREMLNLPELKWADPDHAACRELQDAFAEGRPITVGQLNAHFSRYPRLMGMTFLEADGWYRRQYPPMPPHDVIPTTLHGHLVLMDGYAQDAGERAWVGRYLGRVENLESVWTVEECEAIHRGALDAMDRDLEFGTSRRAPTGAPRIWSLRNTVLEIKAQSASFNPVRFNTFSRELQGGYQSLKRRVRGWDRVLLIAGYSVQEIAELREAMLSARATRVAAAKGFTIWTEEEMVDLVRERLRQGLPVHSTAILEAGYHRAYWGANERYPDGWDHILALAGMTAEQIADFHRQTRSKAAQNRAETKGKTVFTFESVTRLILDRYDNEQPLVGSVITPARQSPVVRSHTGGWEGLMKEVLAQNRGLTPGQVDQLLFEQRAAAKKRGRQSRITWPKERIGTVILMCYDQDWGLTPGVVSQSYQGAVVGSRRYWDSWENAVVDVLTHGRDLTEQQVRDLLARQTQEARQRGPAGSVKRRGQAVHTREAIENFILDRFSKNETFGRQAMVEAGHAGWIKAAVRIFKIRNWDAIVTDILTRRGVPVEEIQHAFRGSATKKGPQRKSKSSEDLPPGAGQEEVAEWAQNRLGLPGLPGDIQEAIEQGRRVEFEADVDGVPQPVRLVPQSTAGSFRSVDLVSGLQIFAQDRVVPDPIQQVLHERLNVMVRSMPPLQVLVSEIQQWKEEMPTEELKRKPRALLLVDLVTAEYLRDQLAEIDPRWEIPVVIVGVQEGAWEGPAGVQVNPEAVLSYLLDLLSQANHRLMDRLEGTFTQSKDRGWLLSIGA